MSNDIDRLFGRLNELAVGFGPIFRDFPTTQTPHYPPHNIISVSDTELILEMAVAGFKKDEITIKEEQGRLTITGDKTPVDTEVAYQHRGIAKRSFSKSFNVAEFYEIASASLEDGILSIRFVKNVPVEAQPKLIAIK